LKKRRSIHQRAARPASLQTTLSQKRLRYNMIDLTEHSLYHSLAV
jgi:hypothetical protein